MNLPHTINVPSLGLQLNGDAVSDGYSNGVSHALGFLRQGMDFYRRVLDASSLDEATKRAAFVAYVHGMHEAACNALATIRATDPADDLTAKILDAFTEVPDEKRKIADRLAEAFRMVDRDEYAITARSR